MKLLYSGCALTLLVGWQKGIRPVKTVGASVVICWDCGADLHIAELMPLLLAVSCFIKIKIGFYFFWYRLTWIVRTGQRVVKWVCVILQWLFRNFMRM